MSSHSNGAARTPLMTGRDGHPPGSPSAAATPPMAGTESGTQVRAAAARRRSRRGLLIAVLVVALGGVLAFAGANMLTRHSQVLAVTRDVPMGQVITSADLVVASVSTDPNLSPIPADERDRVVGMVAQVPLVKGELLTRGQVGAATGFVAGQQLVALPLKLGQLPARGLSPGELVLVVGTPGSAGSLDGSKPAVSQVDAVVDGVGKTDAASGITVVDVRVAAADGPGLARLASTGNLAVIVLPAGG